MTTDHLANGIHILACRAQGGDQGAQAVLTEMVRLQNEILALKAESPADRQDATSEQLRLCREAYAELAERQASH